MAQTQALRCAQDGQWLVARDAERLLGCVYVALPPPGVGEISLLAKRPTGEARAWAAHYSVRPNVLWSSGGGCAGLI